MLNELIGFIHLIYSKIAQEKQSFLTIIVYFIIFFMVFLATKAYYTKDEIINNWEKYKCQPYIIPIAGLFKGDNFANFTRENFTNCYWETSKKYFSILIKPIKYMYDSVTKILGNASNTLNQLRNMAKFIREVFQKTIANVFEQIQTNVSAIQFYSEKFRNLMKKQHAVFQMIYYYLETIRLTFDSFVNGPTPLLLIFLMIFGLLTVFIISMCLLCPIPFVGIFACPICFMCFDPNQNIQIYELDKPISINICNVKISDIIYQGSKVISTFHFILDEFAPLYNYNDIKMSASHIIFKDNIAVRAADCKESKICGFTKKLVCLGTTDNKINIFNNILSDYNEIDTHELSIELNNRILSFLNNKSIHYNDFISYPTGFVYLSLNTDSDSVITHLVKDNNIQIYNYNGILCSGNNIVYENNVWIRVYQSLDALILDNNDYTYIYNTLTKNGIIEINGFKFRDFSDCNSNDINNWLHNMDIELLNKKV